MQRMELKVYVPTRLREKPVCRSRSTNTQDAQAAETDCRDEKDDFHKKDELSESGKTWKKILR